MKQVHKIDIRPGSHEEILPGFSRDFPYIASCAELDRYLEPETPWHWHSTLELFYMEKGGLRYVTPSGVHVFPEGSGGLINAGVLHCSHWTPSPSGNVQLLHLFDPELLSGSPGSRIDRTYVQPFVHGSGIEILPLYPDSEENAALLRQIRSAFDIPETDFGYELRLRQSLCEIWLRLLAIAAKQPQSETAGKHSGDQIKQMMVYVHEHYADHISVDALARAAHVSKRVCFRIFRENLHMTPVEYIQSYRLQAACRMLTQETCSITEIAYRCGLGSSSYFGRVFREHKGCTPAEYRRQWHDRAI